MAINNEPTIQPQTVTGIFTKYIAKTLPLAFDESMSYYECLCALLEYLNEDIVPDINNVNSGLAELQTFYEQLQTYVNTYFDNLNVQNEINNKLDEMVEDGTITNLIRQYIDPIQNAFENNINSRIDTQDDIIDQISAQVNSVTNGNPLVASSTSGMTDTTKIYVNTTDGKWYYYDGDSWEIGGTYQSSVDSNIELANGLTLNSTSNAIKITYSPSYVADKRLDASGNEYAQSGASTSNFLPLYNNFGLHFTLPDNLEYNYICFYDKNYNLIDSRSTLNNGTNNNINIPSDAYYFRFSCKTDLLSNIVVTSNSKLNDRITKIEKNTNLYYKINTFNQFIATNYDKGTTISLSPTSAVNYRYIILDTIEGDAYKIVGKGGLSPRLWAFIDDDNKLLTKSEEITDYSINFAVAPENATKLICNFNIANQTSEDFENLEITKISSYNIDNNIKGYNLVESGILQTYAHINLGVNVGESVSLTPVTAGGWQYIILPVDGINQLYIAGSGGTGPRLWGFLDSSNKLVSKSAPEFTYEGIVNVPDNAYKIIVNYKSSGKQVLYFITNPIVKQLQDRLINSEYEIAKDYEYAITSPDRAMCAGIRGVNLRNQLQNPLTDFKKPTDTMVHVSTFKIINDNVYVTYFASNTSAVEDPQYQIARFVKAPLNDLDNQTYYDIISVGDTFDDKEVTGVYDTILVQVDDNTLHIMICIMINNRYTRVYVPYNISTGQFGEMAYSYFRVGQTRMIFNTTNMETLLNNNNIKHNSIPQGVYGEDIGIMQKFTPHTENEVTYQYSGCYIGTFNCIIKTTDFITFDYVAQPTWAGNYWVENSVYVIGDIAYYYLRQKNPEQAGILSRYYINENRWDTPIYIPDAQSRGDFLKVNDDLYLFHNKNSRFTLSVLSVNQEYINRSLDYMDASVNFYHYPYTEIYNNTIYMIYSQSRSHIYFKNITLGDSNDTISNKIYEMYYS